MAEYNGTTTGAAGQVVCGGRANRRRMKFQNNSANTMRFSADANQPASSTVGIAIPGNQNQIYEFPAVTTWTQAESPAWSDTGVPPGQVTVFATVGSNFHVEEG